MAPTTGADNNGEIAFGALQAGLDLSYSPWMVFFIWGGCDETDEVSGDGSAELLDDGWIGDHLHDLRLTEIHGFRQCEKMQLQC